jgi:hypothetical protein
MAKYLKLQVPSSCNENWNHMVPEQKGRYCLSCQKSVVDFTQMTDSELIAYFKTLKGPTCGRFTQSQLNRDIPIPKKPLPWIKYLVKFSLPALLLPLKSSVQGQVPLASIEAVPVEVAPIKPQKSAADTSKGRLPITGVVSDEAGVPLPGASVYIKGTGRGTLTDTSGHFVLREVEIKDTLTISYVGYETTEVNVSSVQQGQAIQLQLAPALTTGIVVIVGFTAPKIIENKETVHIKKQRPSNASPSILAYPNPVIAGGKLNVQCHSLKSGSYQAALYTLTGQLVQASKVSYSKEDKQIGLVVGQVPPGTYLLQLTHEKSGKQFSQQVVVRN